MKSVRLLPVVILSVTALLVLKTLGLVTTGTYILGGVTAVQAEEAAPAEGADPAAATGQEPTMADGSPELADSAPTLAGDAAADAAHGAAPADGEAAPVVVDGHAGADAALAPGLEPVCGPTDASAAHVPAAGDSAPPEAAAHDAATASAGETHGAAPDGSDFAAGLTGPDCVTLVDAVPTRLGPNGQPIPLTNEDGQAMSEKAVLERLAQRRTELETYQQELDLRASLVDAAEKKIEERQATLQALEAQISALVDQRTEMETGQFAGIITLYENMKPKDAATIFNSLDMEVLLRVAKGMNPRKMSPILAAMDAARAQELTVKMAALTDQPAEQMTRDAMAALPQIVGQ